MCAARQPMHVDRRAFAGPMPRASVRSGFIPLACAALLCALGVDALGDSPAVRTVDIGIVKRRVEGNVSTIRVDRGDTVVLRWRTDESATIHLHGYDLHAKLTPAAQTDMRLLAAIAGRFPITAHEFGAATRQGAQPTRHRETTLLYLEVQPR